ncbi:MAG TPA: hypothetical protein VKI65_02815, partial [Gemmataceae bacterium]|nr:hypothetical protein [Gemmataceae bacterium]
MTALGLVALSAGIYLCRSYTVGSDAEQLGGASAWKITLAAAGQLAPNESSLTMALPPDFRRQHVFDESFQSRELMQRPRKGKHTVRREIWWRSAPKGSQAFRLTYSFRCVIGMRRPTAAMSHATRQLDAPPREGAALKPGPGIESDHTEITGLARRLTEEL